MKLYLLQHGECEPESVDPDRPLTIKGRSDIERLKRLKISVSKIYHSGKLRAQQSAEIIAQEKAIEQRDGLKPNDPIDSIVQEIEQFESDLMIVGHLPQLDKLVSYLLVGDENKSIVSFVPGTLLGLEYFEDNWSMVYMLPSM